MLCKVTLEQSELCFSNTERQIPNIDIDYKDDMLGACSRHQRELAAY